MNLHAGLLCAVASSFISLPASAQAVIPALPASSNQQTVDITVKLSQAKAPFRPIYSWFGYDEANYTTTPLGRHLFGELDALSPVPVHIRVHHLLTSGNGKPELKFSSTNVYSEDAQGHPVYNFTILDSIFDAYKAAGIQPLVELGFMPKDLAANLPNRKQPYEVHFPGDTLSGASNNPPKDYKKWGDLARAVTAHLVQRYGRTTVNKWYFEVWNEPDIEYWHGSREDYFKLYDYAVAGVRAALPTAKVGGPATTGPSGRHAYDYLQAFLNHVKNDRSAATGNKVPLDFISFHAKGHPTFQDGKVTMGLSNELSDVDRGFTLISQYPDFRHLPVILSEADPEGCAACSSRMNPANNYRNGTMYPAYTATAFKGILDLAAEHNTNLIAMLSWSFEFEGKDYFEGFRSLSTNGIDKPILNLFRMLGMMGGERVTVASTGSIPLATEVSTGVRGNWDTDALATAAGRSAAVLLWNYRDADQTIPGTPVAITVKGIPSDVKRVLVENYRIDQTHSNAYTAWQKMGSPQQPTAEQYLKLQSSEGLQLLHSPRWVDVVNGAIKVPTAMPPESASLLTLRW
ncbi:MAG TPA: beta-xylosidase [Acidobacteriaceae bacterium]|nr:beta-xylosidase [Acidobacteriaceae bacterium]